MRDYLSGYLDILPQVEQNKVQELLRGMTNTSIGEISEREFTELVKRIVQEHEQATQHIPQEERLDPERYNAFFSGIQVDLNLMFSESNLIDRALNSYDRLYNGIIADLEKEIKSLRDRINSLRLVAEGEDGLIVKSYDFSKDSDRETNREQQAHLFKDRDGSDVEDVIIQRSGSRSFLSLSERQNIDRLHNVSGATTATVQIVDKRGVTVDQNKYPLANAFDGSPDTYWGEVVLADQEINVPLDNVASGGALVKFTVTLARPEIVSEITLVPFTMYPLEVASITYEEDIETYHQPKELIAQETKSVNSIIISFPSIVAKRFTFILRQANSVRDTYLIREKEISKAELWDKISKRETELTLDSLSAQATTNATVDQVTINSYTGWDIYLTELAKHEAALAQWTAAYNAYQSYRSAIASYNARYGTNY